MATTIAAHALDVSGAPGKLVTRVRKISPTIVLPANTPCKCAALDDITDALTEALPSGVGIER